MRVCSRTLLRMTVQYLSFAPEEGIIFPQKNLLVTPFRTAATHNPKSSDTDLLTVAHMTCGRSLSALQRRQRAYGRAFRTERLYRRYTMGFIKAVIIHSHRVPTDLCCSQRSSNQLLTMWRLMHHRTQICIPSWCTRFGLRESRFEGGIASNR